MNFLSGTGLISAVTAGVTLLRGSRSSSITWRAVLAWASWGITLALAIGAAVDANRAKKGLPVPPDSPIAVKQEKEREKAEKKRAKDAKARSRTRP